MATEIASTKTRFEALSRSAHIDVLLPREADVHVATLIEAGGLAATSRVPTRRNLFFDEQANIFVLLKTAAKEAEVRSILPQLELVLAAHATDAVPQGSNNAASASGKHDVNTSSLGADSFQEIVATTEHTYVAWKQRLHLVRPRARLQRPAIYFTANLTIKAGLGTAPPGVKQQSLTTFEPLPANVLEPLGFGCFPTASNVSISESRITKVAPKSANTIEATVRPIRGATRRAFPVVPALFTRIRYSTLPDAIVASLHLETSHIVAGRTQILHAGLSIANAQVRGLTDVALPLDAYAGDEIILLYKVSPDTAAGRHPPPEQSPVSVSVKAEAILDQGSRILLDIEWHANINLTQTWQKPIYRWSRPAGQYSHHKSLSEQSWTKTHVTSESDNDSSEGGVAFNFGAGPVYDNSEFRLSVHCNNRSSRPRRFGLMMSQPRKHRMAVSNHAATAHRDSSDRPAQFEQKHKLDVLDLNPDAKIGPLPPRACFESHLLFRALRAGVLDMGTLRIIDLDTRQSVEVRELPDTIALAWPHDRSTTVAAGLERGVQSA